MHGSGPRAVARLVVFDNKASRTSGVTADSILELKATTAPFPLVWALGGLFALTVIALLLVVLLRGSGKKGPAAKAAPGAGVSPAAHAAPAASPRPISATQATLQGAAGVFTVSPGAEVRAGRDETKCVVLLNDPSVSGVHASLKLESGQFWVRDERSNNGTFVDNVRLVPNTWTVLKMGAQVRFGPVGFNVRLE